MFDGLAHRGDRPGGAKRRKVAGVSSAAEGRGGSHRGKQGCQKEKEWPVSDAERNEGGTSVLLKVP